MRPRARIGIAVDHMLGFLRLITLEHACSHGSYSRKVTCKARERGSVVAAIRRLPQCWLDQAFLNNCANLIGRPPPSSSDGVGTEGVRPAVVGDGLLVEF